MFLHVLGSLIPNYAIKIKIRLVYSNYTMKKWMDNFTLEQRYYLVSDSVYMSMVEPLGISVEMPFMCQNKLYELDLIHLLRL